MTSFSWLHFSDLHRGMPEQAESWSRIKKVIFEDVGKLYTQCGPWNLVLFTGDLTHSGSKEQFKQVDEFLNELWEEFAKLGHLESTTPQLLAVPGNHDLVWPENPKAPAVAVLLKWSQHEEVWDDFWDLKKTSDYREVINEAFKNYSDWWKEQEYKPKNICDGILPGDFSVTIENKDGAKNPFRKSQLPDFLAFCGLKPSK
ncbi:metallophosphoesterase family protein [Pseudanabaena sp. PCC 6802]|uniref:metallophosphoesterase family protein n=1 Tax=Pseudanabaena sp. PCC 6802 TaxID=118173 RepID=UPI000362A43C|nr:metallophosphoesterase [Pseudanabaena sp. PCC 6802]